MNKEIRQLWLDALRSGKYTQARGALKTDQGYCCLGVLCDIMRPTLAKGWNWKQDDEGFWCFKTKDNTRYGSLPPALHIFNAGAESDLASMNDRGISFKEIANFIEIHL